MELAKKSLEWSRRAKPSTSQTGCTESKYLLTQDMISIDLLNHNHEAALCRETRSLKERGNELYYEIERKKKQKLVLQQKLKTIKRANEDFKTEYPEQTLRKLKLHCSELKTTMHREEMQSLHYSIMLNKEEKNKQRLIKGIAKFKEEFKEIEKYAVDINGVTVDYDNKKKLKFLYRNKELSNEYKEKIERAKEKYMRIVKSIEASKRRIDDMQNNINNKKKHNARYKQKISQYKNQITQYREIIEKFNLCMQVFTNKCSILKQMLKTINKDQVLILKDSNDIHLQTLKNLYKDKLYLLREHKRKLHKLEDELKMKSLGNLEKVKKEKEESLLFDYMNYKDSLKKLTSTLKDKARFLSKITSGIIHIISSFKDHNTYTNDQLSLNLLDLIGDINETGLLPKFSELLLILDQKFTATSFTIVQRISLRTLQASEPQYAPEYIGPITFDISDIAQWRTIMKNYLKKLKAPSANLLKPVQVEDVYDNDDLSKYIERPNRSVKAIEYMEHAFDVRKRPSRLVFNSQPPSPVVAEEDYKEQAKASEEFNKKRLKVKIEKEVGSIHSSTKSPLTRKIHKRHVNSLTLEVMIGMKNKSEELIETATEAFHTLDKIKRLGNDNFKHELKTNKKLTPNFLSIILNMKKSKNNERIRHIAPKCNYFSLKKLDKQRVNSVPNASDIDMNEMRKRVMNLNNLSKLKSANSSPNAFDVFFSKTKFSNLSPNRTKKPLIKITKPIKTKAEELKKLLNSIN